MINKPQTAKDIRYSEDVVIRYVGKSVGLYKAKDIGKIVFNNLSPNTEYGIFMTGSTDNPNPNNV